MADLKDVYLALNELHSAIDKRNDSKVSGPYYQFRYLWAKNGPSCQYLGMFAKQMPIEELPEVEKLVKAYNDYIALKDFPELLSP